MQGAIETLHVLPKYWKRNYLSLQSFTQQKALIIFFNCRDSVVDRSISGRLSLTEDHVRYKMETLNSPFASKQKVPLE